MNKKFWPIIGFLLVFFILFLPRFFTEKKADVDNAQFKIVIPNLNGEFEKVIDPRNFSFPADYGAHPSFQTEWWYYTGNLFDASGQQFGYQLTFFRRAIAAEDLSERTSGWASNQVYLSHFTLTDVTAAKHYQKEKIARGALGLSGAKTDPGFSVNLYDWKIEQTGETTFALYARDESFSISLELEDSKGVIFHGDAGVSRKGSQIGNASYYFSQTRLRSIGIVQVEGKEFAVEGYSWMDHEFGTSALGSDQVGWDWFSLQLDNNTEWMFFQIREDDGNISINSSGTFISSQGITENLDQSDFTITVLDQWSTDDGFSYPAGWHIVSAKHSLDIRIQPVLRDQENRFFFRYWEGAVSVEGLSNGQQISGYGYVELTGYAQSMQGVF